MDPMPSFCLYSSSSFVGMAQHWYCIKQTYVAQEDYFHNRLQQKLGTITKPFVQSDKLFPPTSPRAYSLSNTSRTEIVITVTASDTTMLLITSHTLGLQENNFLHQNILDEI